MVVAVTLVDGSDLGILEGAQLRQHLGALELEVRSLRILRHLVPSPSVVASGY